MAITVSETGEAASRSATTGFVETVWLVIRKDLLIEIRSREILYTTLLFAVACVLVFAFGFVRDGRAIEQAAAGILWIAIAFSETLALGRAFERERHNETLRALLLAPVDRPALYVGKLLGLVLLLVAVETVVAPLVAPMFQAPLCEHPWLMLSLLLSGTVGAPLSGRSSRRCWCAPAAGTCCCRFCCIRSRCR